MSSTENLHFVSSLGIAQASLALHSLLTKLKNSVIVSVCSERSYPVVYLLKLDGLFYPKWYQSFRFLYYYFSVLCKTFKELFSCCAPDAVFSAKADAKVRQNSETPKLFENFFQEKIKVFAFYDNAKTLTPYYIIYRGVRIPSFYSKISSKDSPSSPSTIVPSEGQGLKSLGTSKTSSSLYPNVWSL